jgi:hypothetical protein
VATARVAVVAKMATARPERAVATGSAMATLGAVAFERALATPRAAARPTAATVAEEACVELLRRLHRAPPV